MRYFVYYWHFSFQIVDIFVSLQSLFAWWWGVSITGVENRADTCEIVNTTSPLFTLERDTAVVEIETVSHNVHAGIYTRNTIIFDSSFPVIVLFTNIASTTTATVSCYFTTTTTIEVLLIQHYFEFQNLFYTWSWFNHYSNHVTTEWIFI